MFVKFLYLVLMIKDIFLMMELMVWIFFRKMQKVYKINKINKIDKINSINKDQVRSLKLLKVNKINKKSCVHNFLSVISFYYSAIYILR